jgi:signal transduction histidine kinase
LFFGIIKNCHSQKIERFNSFIYNVNEGLLQSTITDIAFDKNNFCWLSFPNGIQKFDGKTFTSVEVQNGLPDDKMVLFYKCSNGDLLLSHSQGISKYVINRNKFIEIYTNHSSNKLPVSFIGEDDNTIYFHTADGFIKGINNQTFKVVSEIKAPWENFISSFDYSIRFSDNIINHRVAANVNDQLYLWDLKEQKLLSTSSIIPGLSFFLLHLKSGDEVLYYLYSINNALQLYNFTTNTNHHFFIKGKENESLSRCNILQWNNKTLISFNNKLYETDTTLRVLESELVNFQNQTFASNSPIASISQDNYGNLFLVTVTDGIRKIIRNNYPVKYYGTEKIENNFILSVLPDKKNNRILLGTASNGVLVFDTLQRLIKHIKTLPGEQNSFTTNTILKTYIGNYLFFNAASKKVWQLNKDLSFVNSIPISTSLSQNKSGISFFGNHLYQNEQEALTQSQARLYKTNFIANTIAEHEFTTSYTMSGLLYKNNIISHANDELIFLDAVTLKEVNKIPFKNTGGVRSFAKDNLENIYIGSNKGIFKIESNGKILQQWNKRSGLPDECIYAMVFDDNGVLWCSTNKGIIRIDKENSFLQLKKEDGLQENEFNTNVVAKTDDGEIFFGGVNGVSSFYPSSLSMVNESIELLFTSIKINNKNYYKDTAVWEIENITLPYHQNSLAFDFIAMSNSNPDQYIYQYRMKGVDDQWIQRDGLQTVRYYLPPGSYTFQIYASRSFDVNAAPAKEIIISISSPYWKTWWFITALLLVFAALLMLLINHKNKLQYQKKLVQLEKEHELQLEREKISRNLHDSIGAYANAVLYHTELLEKSGTVADNDYIMQDLKFASKDIITSLRETVWALKKESYSAEDCLLRIRNFVQALSRYYPQIRFFVEGAAPENKNLHYSQALNMVRMSQEIITNAIKHSAASEIFIINNEKDGNWSLTFTDNGKGFNEIEIISESKGDGLTNLRKRAAESGFQLEIVSKPGNGTTINVVI